MEQSTGIHGHIQTAWNDFLDTACKADNIFRCASAGFTCGGHAISLLPPECRTATTQCSFDACAQNEVTLKPRFDQTPVDAQAKVGPRPLRPCPSKRAAPCSAVVAPSLNDYDESELWQLEELDARDEEQPSIWNSLQLQNWSNVRKSPNRFKHVSLHVLAEQQPVPLEPLRRPIEPRTPYTPSHEPHELSRSDVVARSDALVTEKAGNKMADKLAKKWTTGQRSSGQIWNASGAPPCISSVDGRAAAMPLGTPELKLPLASSHQALNFKDFMGHAGGADDAAGSPPTRPLDAKKIMPPAASWHSAPEFGTEDFAAVAGAAAAQTTSGQRAVSFATATATSVQNHSAPALQHAAVANTTNPSSPTMSVATAATVVSSTRSLKEAESLRAVVLAGFQLDALNTIYVERVGDSYIVNGRETYWANKGDYILFYCKATESWAVDKSRRKKHIEAGTSSGIASSPAGVELYDNAVREGWSEWDKQAAVWLQRKNAGVVRRGRVKSNGAPVERRETNGALSNGTVEGRQSNGASSAPISPTTPALSLSVGSSSPASANVASDSPAAAVPPATGDAGAGLSPPAETVPDKGPAAKAAGASSGSVAQAQAVQEEAKDARAAGVSARAVAEASARQEEAKDARAAGVSARVVAEARAGQDEAKDARAAGVSARVVAEARAGQDEANDARAAGVSARVVAEANAGQAEAKDARAAGVSAGAVAEARAGQDEPKDARFWVQQIEAIYRRVNPGKLKSDVPFLLKQYDGREKVLFHMVCQKYGLNPANPEE